MLSLTGTFQTIDIAEELKILLKNEAKSGSTELAQKTQIAINTIRADLHMLSCALPRRFSPTVTEDDAKRKFIKFVKEAWEDNENLSAADAILQVADKYQTRFYPTIEDVHKRTTEIRREDNARAAEVLKRNQEHTLYRR